MVVQVGKRIWPDQIEPGRTTLFISKESFIDNARDQPPYPSVATYDAKLWVFFKSHGKSGDYIWNVGKDPYFPPYEKSHNNAFKKHKTSFKKHYKKY